MWIYEFWIGNDPETRSKHESPDCILDDFKDDDEPEFYQNTLKVYLQYLISSFGYDVDIWYRPQNVGSIVYLKPKKLPKEDWLEF